MKTFLKHFVTKKRNVATIKDFLSLTDQQRQDLCKEYSSQQLEIMKTVAEQYPRIELAKAEYSVYGDPIISPGSLVTLSVKFRCLFGTQEPNPDANNEFPDPEDEKQQARKWWEQDTTEKVSPHMPFFPAFKKPAFAVILANMQIGRLISFQKVYGTSKDHICRLQFQAPPETGSWTFQIFIKSDSFIGSDIQFDLKLTVVPATELPYEFYDDYISEPEDYIVGYEKPISKKKSKEERGKYDDSETESESSESEDGHNHDDDNDLSNLGNDGFIE